jgi:hypothetical protein
MHPPGSGLVRHRSPSANDPRLVESNRLDAVFPTPEVYPMKAQPPSTLLYLSYGPGPHADETLYSLLTLRRFSEGALEGITIRIVTDQVDFFEPHGFDVVPVTPATMEEWQGPARFTHRCKIMALKLVMERFGGKCILVDGDTYFRRPPGRLFRRIGPGHSMMHGIEGQVGDSRHQFNRHMGEILEDRVPGHLPLIDLAHGSSTVQWNAGVVGLDPAHFPLLDEVLELTDYFRSRTDAPTSEQLSFSIILAARTRIMPSRDVIFHYNVSPDRASFRSRLPELLAHSAGLPARERAGWLYARRFVPALKVKARNLVKDVLNLTGVLPARDRFDCC